MPVDASPLLHETFMRSPALLDRAGRIINGQTRRREGIEMDAGEVLPPREADAEMTTRLDDAA